MNMNTVVNEVMNLLGLKNDFVFYSMTPYDIQDYLENTTLKIYSRYRPYIFDTIVTFRKEDLLDHTLGSAMTHSSVTYRMPEEIRALEENGLEIFSAGDLKPYCMNRIQNMLGGSYVHGFVDINDVNLGAQAIDMQSYNAVVPRLKAQFAPPNKIIIKNGVGNITENQQYQLRLSCYHSKNLKTMTDGQLEGFKKLAILDIGHYLYHNDLKFMDQINTGNSSTDLKLDLFDEIDSRRNDYIEELKAKQALDSMAAYTRSI